MILSEDLRVALGGKASSEKDGSGGESEEVRRKGTHQLVLGKIKGAYFFTNIFPQIKEDTEMAKNAMPGREGPDNPLESTDDGNIRCKVVLLQLRLVPRLGRLVIHISNGLTQVCDCIMNSGAQAQAHLNGTKHRHRMDKVRI